MTFVDYHNGPNLGLEPTTPRQVRGEYLTLVFEKPISPAVHAIFAAQEWVAASHYDALRERDNYAREVAELRAENKRLREELSKMRGAEPSDEHVSVVGMPEFDALLDHIYEHGTASEGIIDRANAFARALLSRYGRPAGAAQTADDARDAERYRWLRRGGNDDIGVVRGFDVIEYGSSSVASTYEDRLCGDRLDAAIDAAMQRTSGGDHE